MALVFNYAARSDVGRVRSKNDDSAYVGRHLAIVADGMGGHVGGDVASASTVLDLAPLDHTNHQDPSTVLADEIQNANLILNDLVNTNPKLAGMGTTCTALLLEESTLHMAHIGDSRAYRIRDGVFEQISKDHTFVQRLVDEGRLDPSEVESHPHKNVLMRVLGDVDASPELDITSLNAEPGERWLLCSDGLNAVVPDTVIEQKLRHGNSLQEIVEELVNLTLAGGSPDNVTIVVFEVAEADPESETNDDGSIEYSETAKAAAAETEEDRESVSAALLREELASRPHKLVGAAELATNTDQIPIVTRTSTAKRAAALVHGSPDDSTDGAVPTAAEILHDRSPADAAHPEGWGTSAPSATSTEQTSTTQESEAQDSQVKTDHPKPRRRRFSWPLFTMTAVFLVLLSGGLVLSYLWTQSQYYVGSEDGKVAIYQGVSQSLGPIDLSTVETTTDIPTDRLPAYNRQRVESGLPAQDHHHAEEIIQDLEENLTPEAPPVAPSPSPSDSDIDTVNQTTAEVSIGGAAAGAIGGTP